MSKDSKYPGVTRKGDKWAAYITMDGVEVLLGNFISEEHAAMAYLIAKMEMKLQKE